MATKNIVPNDNGEGGIGVTGKRWSTAFINTITGNLTGNVTGNVSGTAATVTGAAQSNITSLGNLTTLTVDDITIDGSTISDGGDFTIDSAGTIVLDADSDGTITLKDNTVTFGFLYHYSTVQSGDFGIFAGAADKDIYLQGSSGGSTVNALHLDMSASGLATFGGNIKIPNDGTIGSAGTAGAITIDSSGNTVFGGVMKQSAATSQLTLNDSNSDSSGSTNILDMTDSSNNVLFKIAQITGGLNAEINQVVNGSLTLKTNNTAALTLANNQNATFAGGVTINGGSNEVEINTNLLDINSTDNITIDATDDITMTSGTASSQGLLTIAQAHKYGQIIINSSAEYQSDSSAIDGIKLLCNTAATTSKVTIDAGIANIQTKSRFAVNYPTIPASSYYIDLKVANSAGTLVQIGNSTSEVRCLDNLNVVGDGRIQSLAGSGNRAVFSTANGTLTNSSSDESLKENKEPIPYGLDSVLNLNPITFNWKDKVNFGSQKEIGFIAQEVQKEVPEVVGSDSENKLTLEYAKLVPVLTKAIQDLEARVKSLEEK